MIISTPSLADCLKQHVTSQQSWTLQHRMPQNATRIKHGMTLFLDTIDTVAMQIDSQVTMRFVCFQNITKKNFIFHKTQLLLLLYRHLVLLLYKTALHSVAFKRTW